MHFMLKIRPKQLITSSFILLNLMKLSALPNTETDRLLTTRTESNLNFLFISNDLTKLKLIIK